MPEWLAFTIEGIAVGIFIMVMYAVLAIILIYMERKVCAAFQCRIGPDRVGGRGGLLQVPADVIKILTKEIISLKNSDKFLYALAPFLVIMASILTFSCLPWNKGGEILHMNIGIFFVLAASSIGVLGILLAGWSSNSKYTLIGAVRSGAMIISYELSIGISVLTMVILCGTMDIQEIVAYQENGWNIFKGHLPAVMAFIIYLIAGNAEANRAPFDLAEAEQELTAGYHTEYSGMHFGFFYLAEYLNLFITAGIAVTLFFGGWMPLHIAGLCRAGRFQCGDGLYPGSDMVRGQDLLCGVPADVDKMDFPSSENRPGACLGMEISDAAVAARTDGYDGDEGVRTGVLI